MEISTIYNPHEQSEQELLDGFVIRENEFNTIFRDVQKNKMQTPPQHYIIYGIRGNGKTSLLLKLFFEVRRDENLSQWLIPIVFKEEQYNVRTLYKLWESIAEYLGEDHDEFMDLLDEMEKNEESKDYEEKCFEVLDAALIRQGKKIILFFDNFGVFLNKLKTKEHQRLREVLITSSNIRIVGASTFVDEATYDYGRPFFDFFKPIYLKGLNKDDTIKLLLKLNEKASSGDVEAIIEQNPGRIEALRRLTSGIPRTIVLLYQIFVDNANGNSFKDLDALLDKVTPLYKSRMDDLPAQQQEIADIIAKNWDAITVKEIAKQAKMQSNAVSSQLKQLVKNRIVIKKGTSTKNNMYQITERFFNIWYLMRYSRKKDKCKVRWLANFLEVWCTKKELDIRVKQHLESLKTGHLYEKYAYHLSEAYAQLVDSSEQQHELLSSTREYLKSIKSNYYKQLSDSDFELEDEAYKYYEGEKPEIALAKLLQIQRKSGNQLFGIGVIYHAHYDDFEKAEQYYLMAIEKGEADAMFNLGKLYADELKDYNKAERYYLMAVEQGHSGAMLNLGNFYSDELKDCKKAERYYLMAVEAGESEALLNLGNFYSDELKDYKRAEQYYLMAVEAGDSVAMLNLGYLYSEELKDYNKAEQYYLMAVEAGDSGAMFNLGSLYSEELKDYEKAERYYLLAVENGHSGAMFNLGNLYSDELKDYNKAEQYYLMAAEHGDSKALFNLGNLYAEDLKNFKKAEQYYLMAVKQGDSQSMFNLGILYSKELKEYKKAEQYYLMAVEQGDSQSMFNLGILYSKELKEYKKAEQYYLMAVEKGDPDAMLLLGNLYSKELKDYKKAEQYYLMAGEQGVSKAINNLGALYVELKDYKKAKQYYIMAAEQGDVKAMLNLGNLYRIEFKDNKKAEQYYLMAAENGDPDAMLLLGNMYSKELKNYKKAEKYYLMALHEGHENAKNGLAWFYFELKRNKKDALKYAKQAYKSEENIFNAHTYACILLWDNEVEKAIEVAAGFMNKVENYVNFTEDIELFLLLLLAKKQYHYVFNLFNENKYNIKDRFKPIYYALMNFMQDEYPDEIKRMGSELEETVNEILERIKQLAEDYA